MHGFLLFREFIVAARLIGAERIGSTTHEINSDRPQSPTNPGSSAQPRFSYSLNSFLI